MQETVNDQRSQEGEGMRSDVSHSPSGSRQEGVKQLSVTMVISALPSITRVTVAAVGEGAELREGPMNYIATRCVKRSGRSEEWQRSDSRKESGHSSEREEGKEGNRGSSSGAARKGEVAEVGRVAKAAWQVREAKGHEKMTEK